MCSWQELDTQDRRLWTAHDQRRVRAAELGVSYGEKRTILACRKEMERVLRVQRRRLEGSRTAYMDSEESSGCLWAPLRYACQAEKGRIAGNKRRGPWGPWTSALRKTFSSAHFPIRKLLPVTPRPLAGEVGLRPSAQKAYRRCRAGCSAWRWRRRRKARGRARQRMKNETTI